MNNTVTTMSSNTPTVNNIARMVLSPPRHAICSVIYSCVRVRESHSPPPPPMPITADEERVARERIVAARNSLIAKTHAALLENMASRESVAAAREQLRELRAALNAYRAAGLESDLLDDTERLYRRYACLFTETETIVALIAVDGDGAAVSRALAATRERVARDLRAVGGV
jgi:hypothetical protein